MVANGQWRGRSSEKVFLHLLCLNGLPLGAHGKPKNGPTTDLMTLWLSGCFLMKNTSLLMDIFNRKLQ
jgi:hypothetical protein